MEHNSIESIVREYLNKGNIVGDPEDCMWEIPANEFRSAVVALLLDILPEELKSEDVQHCRNCIYHLKHTKLLGLNKENRCTNNILSLPEIDGDKSKHCVNWIHLDVLRELFGAAVFRAIGVSFTMSEPLVAYVPIDARLFYVGPEDGTGTLRWVNGKSEMKVFDPRIKRIVKV